MDLELIVRLVAGFALVGANAFFVAVEFALTRLRGLELDEDEIDERGLRRAWELTERLEIHLTGCQLGISSSSVLLGVVAEPAFTRLIEPVVALVGVEGPSVRAVSVVVAVVLLNLVHKIWGEQAPTYLGVERPEAVARRLAPVLAVWSRVMAPVIQLGDGLAKATLRPFGVEITRSWLEEETKAEEPARVEGRAELTRKMSELLTGELPEDRQSEVLQALRIGELPVSEIMIPVRDVVWLRLDEGPDEHVRRIAEHRLGRYPVLREAPRGETVEADQVAGFVYVPALFSSEGWPGRGELELEEHLVPAARVAADTPVAALVDRLQDERQEMAMVVAEDDPERVVGLVTISDATEVVLGDLRDPFDREG